MALSHASARPPSLAESYAYCADLARSHYENFTVISRFTPRRHRPALEAVYAFCRHTDDLGDEAEGDRLTLLDEWEAELTRALTLTLSQRERGLEGPTLIQGERAQEGPTHPIMVALQDTIRRAQIPEEPFRKLIEANRMDQGSGRFETYADVLHYCDHSANPVGRMVLHVLGEASEENVRLSDATCTALQLANFWQDVARDYAMGRIYIPLEDVRAFGCTEEQIANGVADKAFRDLMRFEVDRAQALFDEGLPLATRLSGRARLAIALFSKGGMRVLDAIRRQDYDVLSERPVVTRSRKLWLIVSTAARLTVLRRP
ncbi:MAG: squalene synthase HpnC [Chloroflexi bacterium]|nr:squalene synthase HpnC [Chloroflexota bacterium]